MHLGLNGYLSMLLRSAVATSTQRRSDIALAAGIRPERLSRFMNAKQGLRLETADRLYSAAIRAGAASSLEDRRFFADVPNCAVADSPKKNTHR